MQDALWPVIIILIALCIGGIVFLLRKYVPGLTSQNEPVDEEKQAQEDINRLIVTEELPKEEDNKDIEEDEETIEDED